MGERHPMECRDEIICLGDSLTYGYPYGPTNSWVSYLARESGLRLLNAGVNGDTTLDMEKRFQRDVVERKLLAVVILGGTNDAFCSEITIVQTICAMETMLREAINNDIQPIIGLPLPVVDEPSVSSKLDSICAAYRDLSKRFELPLIDFVSPFIDPDTGNPNERLYIDEVHPNKLGYEVMGKTAVNFFKDYFGQR
ncbi:MAG: GDSL-type esterase/lipase family protein [Thermacetogeniaceae bacterium]